MSLSTRYIREYLELNKTVSLEKIGTLTLPDAITKDENGNIISQPEFIYNKKAETTPEFVNYLAEAVGKSHNIASSDLEYFLDQSRQLMNIGSTPLVIDGLGYIFANRQGEYQLSTEKLEDTKEREKKHYEDNYSNSPLTSATNYATRGPNKRAIGRWVLILLIIGVIILGAYYIRRANFGFMKDSQENTAVVADTLASKKPEVAATPATPPKKEGSYNFIFQTYNDRAQAAKRLRQLTAYGNVVSMDSVANGADLTYRLFVSMEQVAAKDTVRLKDSLRAYYGHAVTIE